MHGLRVIYSFSGSNNILCLLCMSARFSLKTAPENVKALLILDNAPAHPSESVLVSDDGHIRVMFLPPNIDISNTAYGSGHNFSTEKALH